MTAAPRLVAVAALALCAAAGCSQILPSGPVTVTSNYQLVWHDEFTGPAGNPPDTHRWRAQVGGGGWGNKELEYYTTRPINASLDGRGDLAITARRQLRVGRARTLGYTSARLETLGLFHVRYGVIEARIKIPAGAGLWPTFWMLGADASRVGWPESGELDVMEVQGQRPFRLVGTVHGPTRRRASPWQVTQFAYSDTPFYNQFHVYGIIWSRNKIVFSLDRHPYGTVTPQDLTRRDKWVFNQPFYLLLNLAVGGWWVGRPPASTHFPATMLVDWVRVWKRIGG